MPQSYAVLDNGQGGSDRPRGGRKKRAAVARYVESKGGTLRKAGERTKREKRLRSEGRERFESRKAVRKYVTEKGGKLSPAGERGKREMRLRGEGRAAYLASKAPKKKTNTTPPKKKTGGFPSKPPAGIGGGY